MSKKLMHLSLVFTACRSGVAFSSRSTLFNSNLLISPRNPFIKNGDSLKSKSSATGRNSEILVKGLPNENRKDTRRNSASQWHKTRRKQMLSKYSSEILPLEQQAHGLFVGLPLLIIANFCLAFMALRSASLTILQIFGLAVLPGSMFSLWQLQILHDSLHSSLLPKPSMNNPSRLTKKLIRHRKRIQKAILFFGSFPSAYGYYLYLQYGHLTHHNVLGDPDKVSLAVLFNSTKVDFEDGDLLFAVHRMKLLGEIGPKFWLKWPEKKEFILSIGNAGFNYWKEGRAVINATIFTATFLFERMMLILNDFVVALTGKNYFFPNKPKRFHEEGAIYARCATFIRLGLCHVAKSWKPLLFLYLSETLWSIPPHPCCAMFVTNHGSNLDADGNCIPSSSTYAGRWYSILTLGTNYHVEHHDFPTIPLHQLGKLRKIAPEFYRSGGGDKLLGIMRKTFAQPDYYACMNAAIISDS